MSKNNSEDLYSIGNRIRDERERQGLTQEQLAELSDLPRETISRAESGSRAISVDRIAQICHGLRGDSQINVIIPDPVFRRVSP